MTKEIKTVNSKIAILSLIVLLFFAIGLFSTIGTANVSVINTFKIIGSKIPFLKKHIDISNISDAYMTIIWNIRLPRVLLGVLVGAGLSIAGASFQGMFQNPMADPYIIGISSGAALGASLAIILKTNISLFNITSISIFAFLGALFAVILVYSIARVGNKIPVTNLLLSGVGIGQFFTAIMSFLMVIHERDMAKIVYWTLGNLSGKGWDPIIKISLPAIISMIAIGFFARDLNIMLTGEDAAQSLGVDVEKTKIYLIVICSLLTSIIVSVSGIIGFVGLIIPHMVRIILGPDHRVLLPASALLGGIFMIFADTIARTIISPVQIPVGIITALFGGPFFIYLLKTRRNTR